MVRRALLALVLLAFTGNAQASETTSLSGRLGVGVDGLTLADAGNVVVFLEATTETPAPGGAPPASAEVRQIGAHFEPAFLAVEVGQTVEMPNDDVIYHNVFSYSEPNDFDLGLYAAGESHSLRFEHAGLVRIYCSIHEEMNGSIFVAPTRLFAIPDSTGRYSISEVPAGEYRLHVWSARLPELVRVVEIPSGSPTVIDLALGAASD